MEIVYFDVGQTVEGGAEDSHLRNEVYLGRKVTARMRVRIKNRELAAKQPIRVLFRGEVWIKQKPGPLYYEFLNKESLWEPSNLDKEEHKFAIHYPLDSYYRYPPSFDNQNMTIKYNVRATASHWEHNVWEEEYFVVLRPVPLDFKHSNPGYQMVIPIGDGCWGPTGQLSAKGYYAGQPIVIYAAINNGSNEVGVKRIEASLMQLLRYRLPKANKFVYDNKSRVVCKTQSKDLIWNAVELMIPEEIPASLDACHWDIVIISYHVLFKVIPNSSSTPLEISIPVRIGFPGPEGIKPPTTPSRRKDVETFLDEKIKNRRKSHPHGKSAKDQPSLTPHKRVGSHEKESSRATEASDSGKHRYTMSF